MTADTASSPESTTFAASTIGRYLDDLAAKIPAPGGGAVAALHAAQGAALVAMVARYTTRAKDADNRPAIDRILAAADAARGRALALADADAAAFTAVGAAYKLPKTTDAENAARARAIEAALLQAARVPAAVVAEADEIVSLATDLLPIGNPNVVTDIGAAADAARAAAASSQLNIAINVASLADHHAGEFEPVLRRVEEILARADALHADVVTAIAR
ncbi:cyclodeaminase/cyclohydrolase family protein [Nocardia sp. CDC159]|uniref:Cyclodeaminase/cyclohydrolase family protein n=1 Tax=Nocardia pulmonis TaxID=2951408 RepID=A0A9X2IVB6_9NOCA|nr:MULTISPECIES: cyclodeaminase/cyclohydrolase family protein [Nocardia]MCM6772269.1 cyclodeaminase/cyclohydrolase family protein [Nocardia pulmonis]MCM6785073.1 cyclodeaminase/cyclohydrolase family protein [Nocardia sp. CDC159]